MSSPSHILALYEPTRRGGEAIRLAAQIAAEHAARLTVITVAVQEPTGQKCCDTRSVYWNGVVQEFAAEELASARGLVQAVDGADFRVVTGRSVASAVADEAARCDVDTVVVPRRRGLLPWSRTRHVRHVQRRAPHAEVLQPSVVAQR
jgi:K+-sensing histidine kinase KdpD